MIAQLCGNICLYFVFVCIMFDVLTSADGFKSLHKLVLNTFKVQSSPAKHRIILKVAPCRCHCQKPVMMEELVYTIHFVRLPLKIVKMMTITSVWL